MAVEGPEDVAAAVRFAAKHGVKLVVKGTGHDYLGRSSAPNSLLVWTRPHRAIEVLPEFRPEGSPQSTEPVAAMRIQAGANWGEVYNIATRHGLFVQGGHCATEGAAGGFVQGGGFGRILHENQGEAFLIVNSCVSLYDATSGEPKPTDKQERRGPYPSVGFMSAIHQSCPSASQCCEEAWKPCDPR